MQIYGIRMFNIGRFAEENNSIVFDIFPEDKESVANGLLTYDEIYDKLKENPVDYIQRVKEDGIVDLISICGIKGEDYDKSNGVGKTTVLESICYAHYDRTLKKSITDKIERAGLSVVTRINGKYPVGLKESYVEEIFEEGGKIYWIKRGRTFSGDQKNSQPLLEFECISGEDTESFAGHRTRDTNDSIAAITPWDYDVFVNGAMFGQGDAGKFLSGTDKVRKEIMINLLRLEDVVKGCLESIREKKNKKEKELDTLNGQFELLSDNLSNQSSMEDIQKSISEATSLIKQYDESTQKINKAIEDFSKSDEIKKLASIKEEGKSVSDSLKAQESQQESQVKEWLSLIENSKSQQLTQGKKVKDTNEKIKQVKELIVAKKKIIDDFDMVACEKDLNNVKIAKEKEPEYIKRIEELRGQSEKLAESIATVLSDNSRVSKERDSLLEQLNNAGEKEEFVCDKCKSKVSKEHIQSEIFNNEKAIKEYSEKHNEIKSQREDVLKQLEGSNSTFQKITDWLRKEEKIKADIKSYNDSKDRIKELEKDLQEQEVSLKEFQKELEVSAKSQKEYETKSVEIKNKYTQQIKELNDKLFNLQLKYKEAQEGAKSIEENIKVLKRDGEDVSRKKSDSNLKIGSLKKDVENIERDKKKIKELEKIIEKENTLLKRFLILEGVFGLEGIQTRIVNKYLPLLNVYIKEFLNIVTNGEIVVELFINNRSKVDIRISGGTADTYYLLSGGEKQVVRLAVNVALALVSFSRSAQKPDIICLDEIFGPIDNCYTDGVFRLLRDLRSRFGRVIIISHKPSINDKIPHKIVLEKGEGDYGRTTVRSIE